jgi:alpha-tubulin suppressor-like RCC1 family protein
MVKTAIIRRRFCTSRIVLFGSRDTTTTTYPLTTTKDHQPQDTSLTMDKKRPHGESPLQPEEQPLKNRRLVKNNHEKAPQTRRTILAFGSNQTSSLGLPSLAGDLYDFHTPNESEGIRQLPADVASVAATSCSTVCLTRDGRVYTMGSDEGGL